MAVQRGVESLVDTRLPKSATLPPSDILQPAIKGFVALREMELDETRRLIPGSTASPPCFSAKCDFLKTVGRPRAESAGAHQKAAVGRVADPSQSGTKVLKVLSLGGIRGDYPDARFCESCVEGWEAGRAEMRKRAWDMLPEVFGLKAE